MLCIAGVNKGKDYGFVLVAGKPLTPAELGELISAPKEDIESLLAELERNGVFSRDRRGVIYSRRMVRSQKNRTNGKLGGNPNLKGNKENPVSVSHSPKAHIPEPEPEPVDSKIPGRAVAFQRDDWPNDYADRFWAAYPPGRKTGRKPVGEKLARIRKSGTVSWQALMAGLQRYIDSRPGEFVCGPMVWLNREGWNDEITIKRNGAGVPRKAGNAFARIAAQMENERMDSHDDDDRRKADIDLFAGADGQFSVSDPGRA